MFKKLFNKLTFVFFSIIFVSFLIAGVLVYFMLTARLMDAKESSLIKDAQSISAAYYKLNEQEFYVTTKSLDSAESIFQLYINDMAKSTGSLIYIVTRGGIVKQFSQSDNRTEGGMLQNVRDKLTQLYGYYTLTDPRQYDKIFSNKYDYVVETGDFYGMFTETGKDWLTVEVPIRNPYSNTAEVLGSVMIHTPISEIYRPSMRVLTLYAISFSIAILIATTLLYFIVKKITSPINKMNSLAQAIAQGDFSMVSEVKSKDEIGQLQQSINDMAFSLKNTELNRREFIANVSHELKTPITSIKGFIGGILDETIAPENQHKYLMVVNDEISRLSRLVSDLLDLSRMESGEVPIILKRIDINEMIRRSVLTLENAINQKNIELNLKLEGDKLYVNADSDSIERVIINLLHNSIKFTQNGGQITVSTKIQRDKVTVQFKDNGIGMTKDELHYIWDRFYKTDKSRSQDKKGTGLGLSIVKSIIKAHKQNIWAESEPGRGSVFTFTLERS